MVGNDPEISNTARAVPKITRRTCLRPIQLAIKRTQLKCASTNTSARIQSKQTRAPRAIWIQQVSRKNAGAA
eukprot:9910055-Alexandrium_andersonii.AAC.1